MPLESFKTSQSLTLGVELELQLINLTDFDLSAACPDMLHLLRRSAFPGNVTPEITDSMIEIATDVHTGHDGLLNQLQSIRDTLVRAGDRLNVGVCGGGTHPFQRWFERRIFPKPRFKEVSALYGYLAKQFTVFGQHVHIGCSSGDEALFLLHALNRYVPHFIALSASSPYFQGGDTLFNSARLNSVFAFPLSGRAPFILRWAEFERDYFAKMEHTGVVRSMKDFYWDIRPKPEYGTIELRVCDTPLTVERAAALACYLQALCRHLLTRAEAPPAEDDYLVYNYNRFQACRFGLDGSLVHPKSHETLSLREDILATLRHIEPHAEALGGLAAMECLGAIAHEGNDACYLRQQHAGSGSLEGVVDAALGRFRAAPDKTPASGLPVHP
ncbi:YbdK family carboxylate-amine ligase [Candidatus Ferrigenium straubiae]|jgi:carboxylate-amine ligase|uniref:YbdK family carboxylate-amine ligase n=1 Tax=Candidatus Ferrigenium straubiae TaxID=2919506 RepID=UPI003F4AED1D